VCLVSRVEAAPAAEAHTVRPLNSEHATAVRGARLSPGLRRVAANMSWLMLDRLVRLGMAAVVGVWIARYLGPTRYGTLSYAIAWVMLFSAFATLGLDSIVIRDLVRAPAERHEVIGTAFALKAGGGALAALLAIGGIFLLRPHDTTTQIVVAVVACSTIFTAFDVIDFSFQSEVASKYVVLARLSAFAVCSLARIMLILLAAGLVAFGAMITVEAALAALGLVLVYRRCGGSLDLWSRRASRARALLGEGWPLMFSGVAIAIYMQIDQVMLGQMASDHDVGIYAAAVRLSQLWYFIPLAIVSSVFPSIIRARELGQQVYLQRILRLFSLMTAIALTIALPLTLLASPLVTFVYGAPYAAAGPVLAVHIWSSLFVFWGVAQGPWYITEGLVRLQLYRAASGAVANVLLNLVLIPRYQSMGAAIATVISYGVADVLWNAFNPKTRVVFILQMKSLAFPRYLLSAS
jgi:PST family polysaccharide transporter